MSGSDKVYISESEDEVIEDSWCENKVVLESEDEVIPDSEDEIIPDSDEEDLPNFQKLLKPASNGEQRHHSSVLPSPSFGDVSSPPRERMFDHLQVSGNSPEGKMMSSTPTLDTSNWRRSNIVDVDSEEDGDSPVCIRKGSKARTLIDSDISNESSFELPVYSRARKKDSLNEKFDSSKEDSSLKGSDCSQGVVEASGSLDESLPEIPVYSQIRKHTTLDDSIDSNEEDSVLRKSDCSQDIDDSLASSNQSLPVVKKKLFNVVDFDEEAASIRSFESASAKNLSCSEVEDKCSSISPENLEIPAGGDSFRITETVTPSSSPEKALTPQEKYGHKFRIKKKTPLKDNSVIESPSSYKSNSILDNSVVEKTKALTPQEKYGHKFQIKKMTPLKDSSLYESPSYKSGSMLDDSTRNQSFQSSFVLSDLTSSEMKIKLNEKKKLLRTTNLTALPDGGSKIRDQIQELEEALANLSVNGIEEETSSYSERLAHSSVTTAPSREDPVGKSNLESSVIIVESPPQSPASPTLKELERKLEKKKERYKRADLGSLADGGAKMRKKISLLEQEIARRKGSLSDMYRFDSGHKQVNEDDKKKKSQVAEVMSELESKKKKLEELKMVYRAANPRSLPDGGVRLKDRITSLEKEIMMLELKENIEKKTSPPEVITVEGPKMNYKQSKITDYGLHSAVAPSSKKAQHAPASAFNMDAMYDIEMDYLGRNYGGKISLKREREMIRVTSEAVQDLHDALENAPSDEVEEEDPHDLTVSLMPHQKQALAWLLYRETQLPRGGILADDMGLGKTLTMISLILKHNELVKKGKIAEDFADCSSQESDAEKESDEEKWMQKKNYVALPKRKKLVTSSGTLVVCPASLLGQWEGEIQKRVGKYRLNSLIYHGTKRENNSHSLASFDVVITTYQIVMKEGFPSQKGPQMGSKDDVPKINISNQGTLFRVGWTRIILDEGHQIRNHKSKTSQAVCMLRGGRRWVLTGTPVQNKEMDLYSLIRFLRAKPFDDYTCWKLQVSNNSAQGMQRLSLLVKALLLRRTKDQIDKHTGKQLIELPEKTVVQHTLSLTQEEREVYDRVFQFSRSTMTHYMKTHEEKEQEKHDKWSEKGISHYKKPDGNKYTPTLPETTGDGINKDVKAHHLLILLLRLRQICSHPSLIKGMVETETEMDGDDLTGKEGVELDIVSQMAEMSLKPSNEVEEEADMKINKNVLTVDNPIFQRSLQSSKIESVIEELIKIREEGNREKAVIVSQWTSMLEIVEDHLKRVGIRCHIISGQVQVKDRTSIVNDFNGNASGAKVMLLSLGAGGVGLNLVGANHLFLLDMHWNPQLEAQACDRIYRVGQTRPVTIHRFVIQNTVEERILELQQKKLKLAADVLSGAKRSSQNKLTLDDMKALFDIGGAVAAKSFPP